MRRVGESAILKLALFTVALFVQFDGGVIDVRNASNLKLPRHPIRIYWEKKYEISSQYRAYNRDRTIDYCDMLAQP